MKKIIGVLLLVASMYGGQILGCKKRDSMLMISGASDRVGVATKLVHSGECAIITNYSIIEYDYPYVKVLSTDGNYYWVLKNML